MTLLVPFAIQDTCYHLLAFDSSGTRLVYSQQGSDSVTVYDAGTGQVSTAASGFEPIQSLAFHSTNNLLVATESECLLCDLDAGKRQCLLPEHNLSSIAIGPKGRIIAFGTARGAIFYDTRKREVMHRLKTDFCDTSDDPVWCKHIAFSTAGHYAACAFAENYGRNYLVVIWEVATGRRQRIFDTLARALAFRDDSLNLALADEWGRLRIYEQDEGEEPVVSFQYQAVEYLAGAIRYLEGGTVLELLLDKGRLLRLFARTGKLKGAVKPPPRDDIYCATVGADWSIFAGACREGIVIWRHEKSSRSRRR